MPALAPPLTDERDLLLSYLAQQRLALRMAAYGLTDEEARMTPTASALSAGGAIKHTAFIESGWIDLAFQRPRVTDPRLYMESFAMGPDETLEGTLAGYDEVARQTEELVRAATDLNQPVPVPKGEPWFPQDIESWPLRWVLLHVMEETARHAGHADIIREEIDGAQAFPLMAAAEGWPETPWMKPWKRAESS